MERKLYPIGIQTFERIRKEDMLYIDKTAYVYHMTHTDGRYFFLSRPAITMETDRYVYIIELNFSGSAHEALQQINRQRYADVFALQQKQMVKVGMNFEVKD